ncbi:MAG TPA: Crp/Fnr family transcriptional regulator [Myxococcota bacterium]|jgi:CRP/FNR family transcriptional regulator|nr:Crp/Fnr family transcriptional regulator [Myxococcota bacterium]
MPGPNERRAEAVRKAPGPDGGSDVPARCESCLFYRFGTLSGLRAAPGDPWRCDLVPGQARGRTVLASESRPARRIFAIRTGLGRVYRSMPSGRLVALRLVRPGELVGMEALSGDDYAASFESLGDLQYCTGDPARIASRAAADAELGREVLKLTARETEAYRRRVASLAVLDRRGRMAELLLDMERAGGRTDGWCEMLLAQQEAAELLGSTQETMSRVLAEMVKRRWIERRGRLFHVLDRVALRAAAAGEMERPAPGRHVAPA